MAEDNKDAPHDTAVEALCLMPTSPIKPMLSSASPFALVGTAAGVSEAAETSKRELFGGVVVAPPIGSEDSRFKTLIKAGQMQPPVSSSKRKANADGEYTPTADLLSSPPSSYRSSSSSKKKRYKLPAGASLAPNVRDPSMAPCNCRKSHCLKLYCECFAAKVPCQGCNCENCQNTSRPEHASARANAVRSVLFRNPNAFQPKIKTDTSAAGHTKGCHCKKSHCLKKYCECFQANVLCSRHCKCLNCKNFEGSVELKAKRHAKPRSGGTKRR